MNRNSTGFRSVLLMAMLLCGTIYAAAQEQNTQIQGYYQTYRDFSFKAGTGFEDLDIPAKTLSGGGFAIAQNLAPWFAMWTQFTFYGRAGTPNDNVRIIHNLEGIRYQTKQHGPLQLYAKFGMGFSNYSMNVLGNSVGETKFSLGYGAGAFLWVSEHFGVVLDASQNVMGVPNLTDAPNRDKWDSGLALTTGLSVRF
jgi:hypothetical protein